MTYPVKKFPIKNSFKSFISNFILRRPVPMVLSLDVTNRCNARCPWCGFWRRRPPKEMSSKEIKKILEEAYDLGCFFVMVTGGEPLLRNDLPEIFDYAKAAGLSTVLLTNGYLLPDKIREIYRNLDVVSVSVDFADSRQDRMRHLDGLLERIIDGIKLAHEYGITTNMNSIITGMHRLEDIEDILSLAKRLDSGISFSPMVVMPESYDNGTGIGSLSKEGEKMIINDWNLVKTIAERLLYLKSHGYRKTIQNSDAYLKLIRDRSDFTCYPFSLQFSVTPNGHVGHVCFLGLRGPLIGNTFRQSLKEIWYSEKAESFRKTFRECKLADKVGCYLLCIAELSLLYDKPSLILDYLKRVI